MRRLWHIGAIAGRNNGVLISKNQGQTTAYSIEKLQDRGKFFVDPGEEVYAGMIVGEQNKPGDLVVNIVEGKQLNNMRAAGKDKDGSIAPKIKIAIVAAVTAMLNPLAPTSSTIKAVNSTDIKIFTRLFPIKEVVKNFCLSFKIFFRLMVLAGVALSIAKALSLAMALCKASGASS